MLIATSNFDHNKHGGLWKTGFHIICFTVRTSEGAHSTEWQGFPADTSEVKPPPQVLLLPVKLFSNKLVAMMPVNSDYSKRLE